MSTDVIELVPISPAEIAEVAAEVTILAPHDRDEMALPTYTHKNPLARWIFWKRHRQILRLCGSGGQSVLDFGTGTGALLPSLCAGFKEVHATDLRDAVARCLVKRRGLPVQFHDAGRLEQSLPDGGLDVIIAADVLEHVEEPIDLLRMFKRKLRSGGAVIASIPTENWLYRMGRFVAGFSGRADYHKTGWVQIRRAFADAGFHVERKTTVPFPGPLCLFEIGLFKTS
jgi:SAM-dependent methyltransferase